MRVSTHQSTPDHPAPPDAAFGSDLVHVEHAGWGEDLNLVQLSRKHAALKPLVVRLANAGYFMGRYRRGRTSFVTLAALRRLWALGGRAQFRRHQDLYYKVKKATMVQGTPGLLVVFSSVADVMYDASLVRRNFFENFATIDKYVPQNVHVLRISDIGSVVGSFYLDSLGVGGVEAGVRHIIASVAGELSVPADRVMLYGASKGATAALFHGATGGWAATCVDPIVSDEHYVQKFRDSHFTQGTFASTKQARFRTALQRRAQAPVNIICSPRSPQLQYIDEIVRQSEFGQQVNFFQSFNTRIKDHPDVGPQTTFLVTTLITNFFLGLQVAERLDLSFT